MIIEACVENLADAQSAQAGGADQIELCGRLDVGGLTPDEALVKATMQRLTIPVKVMIRPRAGDFVFSEQEVQQMLEETGAMRALGVLHFVIGLATEDQQLDLVNIQRICAQFPGAIFTLHKVIDSVSNPLEFIPALNRIPNLSSILSSGGAATALEGAAQIVAIDKAIAGDKHVIAAGKITAANLPEVKAKIPVKAYHGRKIIDWSKETD
ncbi:MAG: copper homeostasis protein CutC [Bacteroidota bacterium]